MIRDITSQELDALCEPQPFEFSSNSQIYLYKDGQKVFKFHGTRHEVDMMLAAGDCSVRPCERVLWVGPDGTPDMELWGFTMKRETPLLFAATSLASRSALMQGMISCVLALHTRGIAHGDIKPANMLLCSDGKVRLCDFAEARLLDQDPADWEGGTTTNYLSPQRCRNWFDSRDAPPDIEDDLYALGLSIWELYTGKMPFDDIYEDDIREMVKAGQTVDVMEIEDPAVREVICGYLRCGGAKV